MRAAHMHPPTCTLGFFSLRNLPVPVMVPPVPTPARHDSKTGRARQQDGAGMLACRRRGFVITARAMLHSKPARQTAGHAATKAGRRSASLAGMYCMQGCTVCRDAQYAGMQAGTHLPRRCPPCPRSAPKSQGLAGQKEA